MVTMGGNFWTGVELYQIFFGRLPARSCTSISMADEETCDNALACTTVLEAVQSLNRDVAGVTR